MSSYGKILSDVDHLIDTVKPAEAEKLVRSWIDELSAVEVDEAEPFVLRAIGLFLPKRQERLRAYWAVSVGDKRSSVTSLMHMAPDPVQEPPANLPVQAREVDVRDFARELRTQLQELSDRYIFQWATRYTSQVNSCFAEAVRLSDQPSTAAAVIEHLAREYREHAREIFEKGLDHGFESGDTLPTVVDRSRRGLIRFLAIPTNVARNAVHSGVANGEVAARIASAILRGILVGFCRISHQALLGGPYLLKIAKDWCSVLAYLHPDDVYAVANELPPGALRDSAVRFIYPAAIALHRIAFEGGRVLLRLPGQANFVEADSLLEYSIPMVDRPHAPPILVHYYLAPEYADVRRVEESAYRGASLIIGSFSEFALGAVQRLTALRPITVHVSADGGQDGAAVAQRAIVALQRASVGRGAAGEPVRLTYNWAKEFPLYTSIIAEQYRVRRPSVRILLGNVERRNGVHVWCSVRRSGKSTACFALQSTTGSSTVLAQTTAPNSPYAGATQFYRALSQVIQAKDPLPDDFVESTVQACIPAGRARGKVVLILDEYESLFHRINELAVSNVELRYTIVHPLLSQLVAFSQHNLLILVGQRPDAHQILLDHNQLSPYVQQDPFPLFEHHSAGHSEFRELLTKVLPEPFELESSFVQAVYRETGGHPYLTVSTLSSFVEWLIEQQRSMADLVLQAEDFRMYAERHLVVEHIALVSELGWFYGVAAQALGEGMRTFDPWLHAVYWTMQQICRLNPRSLACSRSDYHELAQSAAGRLHVAYDPDYILRSASEANFLTVHGDTVMPRIRILGRLAAVASARSGQGI